MAGPSSNLRPTVQSVRIQRPYLQLLAISAIAFGFVLYLTSYKNFYYDEWDFIVGRRPWNPQAFLLPELYHMAAIPIFVWKLLFLVVGLRTYVPYEAMLLLTHVTVALLLFALIRQHSGDLPAFAASATLLFFGAGSYDIVFAFEMTFVGAVAFGLAAILLARGTSHFGVRTVAISLALVGGLMCHVLTFAFMGAMFVELGLDSKRRWLLVAIVPPVIAFLAWYLIFDTGSYPGASGVTTELLRGPTGLPLVADIIAFVVVGAGATAAGAIGLPVQLGAAVLGVVAAFVAWGWYRRGRIEGWQLGMLAGLVGFFGLTGLGRLQFGVGYAAHTRYVYVGAVFLLPLIAHVVRELPWRGIWRPALTLLFGIALLSNITQLRDAARVQVEFMKVENAELQTTEFFRSAPDMARKNFIDQGTMWALRAGDYLAARDELGSPVPPLVDGKLDQLPSWAVDRVMVNLFGDALAVQPASTQLIQSLPCQNVDTSKRSALDFRIHHDQTLVLESSKSGKAFVFLGFIEPPSPVPVKTLDVPASTSVQVHLPNTGRPLIWQLRIQTLEVGMLRVCSEVAPQLSQSSQYGDVAASFTLGPGWSYRPDVAATTHWAAKAAAGTLGPEGAFDDGFVPAPGAYDIWYRVRVANNAGKTPEMVLAVVDVDATRYVASATLRPNQVGGGYSWVLVASNVTPTSGHHLRFQTNIAARLSTDWYVDRAVMVPAGTPTPQSA